MYSNNQPRRPRLQFTRELRVSLVLILIAILSLLGAGSLILHSQQAAQDVNAAPVVDTVVDTVQPSESIEIATPDASTEDPAPTPQPTVSTPTPVVSQPAATTPEPAYDTVSIPALGFSSRFVNVGLTSDGDVDVHPTLVGRWTGRALPGQDGAVFLDGHNPGVLSKLPSITIGNTIDIKMANGEGYSYKVVYREIVDLQKVNMKNAITPYGGATQGLNMMTCIGAYDPAIGTSPQRLIVYAVRA